MEKVCKIKTFQGYMSLLKVFFLVHKFSWPGLRDKGLGRDCGRFQLQVPMGRKNYL